LEPDNTVYIQVPDEEAGLYTKLDGFTFMGQKLSISRPGSGNRSSEGPRQLPAPSAQPQNQVEKLDSSGAMTANETIQMLQRFLARRYIEETKHLNLTAMATDPELSTSGLFDNPSRQTKFFSALMKVCDDAFTSPQEKRERITSISLSSNGLTDLNMIHSLRHTFPDIVNLDLSANAFKSTRDLARWKNNSFPRLDLLLLNDNPLVTSQPEWEKDILRWFPRLRYLNHVQIRTDIEIARLDQPKETPKPSSGATWNDVDGVAERFLLDFCPGFDTERATLLAKYYDNESNFSLAINMEIKGGAKNHDKAPWDAYIKFNRNNKSVKNPKARESRIHRGPEKIGTVWQGMPPTRHPSLAEELSKYKFECQPISGVPTPGGPLSLGLGLKVDVHGEFEEHNTVRGANEIVRRSFDRTFVLGPGGATGVRVVSDSLTLRPHGGVSAWEVGVEKKDGEMEVEL
jgi:nuclear RNA export factor